MKYDLFFNFNETRVEIKISGEMIRLEKKWLIFEQAYKKVFEKWTCVKLLARVYSLPILGENIFQFVVDFDRFCFEVLPKFNFHFHFRISCVHVCDSVSRNSIEIQFSFSSPHFARLRSVLNQGNRLPFLFHFNPFAANEQNTLTSVHFFDNK